MSLEQEAVTQAHAGALAGAACAFAVPAVVSLSHGEAKHCLDLLVPVDSME